MVNCTISHFGRLDILVNNAGFTRSVPLADLEALSEEIWDKTLAINLKGAFFCARAATPPMKRQGSGAVVNIASVAGINGQGSSIAYCASKAGLISLTKSLAIALAPEIRVNGIAPGFVMTRWNAGRQAWHPGIIAATPLHRLGEAEDIGRLAVALVADASFVTGQTIIADGGNSI